MVGGTQSWAGETYSGAVRKFSERVGVRGGAKIIVYEMCPRVEKCVSGGGDCITNRAEILKKFVYMEIIYRGF